MADPTPSNAQMLAEAYRRGLLPPDRAAAYEEAARRGLVNDPYAATRASADPVTGSLTNVARNIPGLSELGAGYSAALRTADDALSGRKVDFGARWNQARAEQQGEVDRLRQDHPIVANLSGAVGDMAGTVGLMKALPGPKPTLRPVAIPAKPLVQRSIDAGRQALATGARNAVTGAMISGGYAAAQPGTADERATAARNALLPGAVAGVAAPAVAKGVTTGARLAIGAAKPVGAVTSEAVDAASRALTGKTTTDQVQPLTEAQQAQGRTAAVKWLQRQGVTPEGLAAARTAAGGKPITTAEAIGPSGISQATGLARRAGTTPATAEATMAARAGDRSARILNDIHETTGVDPVAAQGDINAIVQNGQAAAGPLYDAIRNDPTPIWSPQLEALSKRPKTAEAIQTAISQMRSEGRDPHALGLTFMEDPESAARDIPVDLDAAAPASAPRGPARAPSQGLSVLRYIAKNGGITDDRGEMSARDAQTWHVGKPFMPKLIGNGGSADDWGVKLQEAGYLPPGDRPSERDVYGLVDRELSGNPVHPIYSQQPDAAAMDRFLNRNAFGERAAWEANHGGDVPSPEQYQGSSQPTTSPVDMKQPTAETWDLVKRALQRNVERHPLTGAPLPDSVSAGNHAVNTEATALTAELRKVIPGYGDALDTAGDYLSAKGAYDRAKGVLFSPSKDPRDFASYFQGLSPAEQNATRASLANDIFSKVNNGQLRPGSFAVPAVQQKLATVFGPDAASALVDRMSTEAKMSAASARMTPNLNSVTPDVMGAEADRSNLDSAIHLGGAAVNALSGRPVAAARGVARAAVPFIAAARQPVDMASRNALGDILYQSPQATIDLMRSLDTSPNAFAPPPVQIPRSVSALQIAPAQAVGVTAGQGDDQAYQ
jgi:hypothetical protein